MTNCTYQLELTQGYKRRKIEVNFEGGNITSDGGVLFLREADRKLKFTKRAAGMIPGKTFSFRQLSAWTQVNLKSAVAGTENNGEKVGLCPKCLT